MSSIPPNVWAPKAYLQRTSRVALGPWPTMDLGLRDVRTRAVCTRNKMPDLLDGRAVSLILSASVFLACEITTVVAAEA
jgi:hypothetical protein